MTYSALVLELMALLGEGAELGMLLLNGRLALAELGLSLRQVLLLWWGERLAKVPTTRASRTLKQHELKKEKAEEHSTATAVDHSSYS